MQKGMGGDEQHGMSVMPCTLCSQHGAKKSAEREELMDNSECSNRWRSRHTLLPQPNGGPFLKGGNEQQGQSVKSYINILIVVL